MIYNESNNKNSCKLGNIFYSKSKSIMMMCEESFRNNETKKDLPLQSRILNALFSSINQEVRKINDIFNFLYFRSLFFSPLKISEYFIILKLKVLLIIRMIRWRTAKDRLGFAVDDIWIFMVNNYQ